MCETLKTCYCSSVETNISMASKTSSSSGGISFTGALTILFIGLKLAHVINWSWLWVLSPIWISLSLGLTILLIAAIIVAVTDR